jgi:exodeoxyribonuclease-5
MGLAGAFIHAFPFEPTEGQLRLFAAFERFVLDRHNSQPAFVIRGYAGTGKTSVVSAIINVLYKHRKKFALLAPTGRAAKVLASYSGFKAFTIHRFIYRSSDDGTGAVRFSLQKNSYENTIFFVDEASMINDDAGSSVLSDLIMFVYDNPGNKLVFIGDTAQLPPVGKSYSPALDAGILGSSFRLQVEEQVLTKVMRQQMESGILYNATRIRALLLKRELSPMLSLEGYSDIGTIAGGDLEDALRSSYDGVGEDDTLIITGANARANKYNEYIRMAIFFREEELEVGDRLMAVKNNYVFLPDDSRAGFIANGDFLEVLKIKSWLDLYGYRFADVVVRLCDYPDEPSFEVRLWLDALHVGGPAMGRDDQQKLYEAVRQSYLDDGVKLSKVKASLKKDITLQALQVKFAYALTCHKSQGGQWKHIYLEPGFYQKDGEKSEEYLRWLYTGMTRATEQLKLVGFPQQFFE